MSDRLYLADKHTLDLIKQDTGIVADGIFGRKAVYDKAGTYSWRCPENVYKVLVTAVGAGGGGGGGMYLFGSGSARAGLSGGTVNSPITNMFDGAGGVKTAEAYNRPGNDAMGNAGGGGGTSSINASSMVTPPEDGRAGGVSSFSNLLSVSGGSGGERGNGNQSNTVAGRGGSGGEASVRKEVFVTPGDAYTITVGAGGVGGNSVNNVVRGGRGADGIIIIEW